MSTLKIERIGNSCTACSACYNICPRQAISMEENSEGFYMPRVDSNLCIECNLCEKVCPILNVNEVDFAYTAYYGYSKDRAIQRSSSSGGAFCILASQIIKKGGVVFGAAFNYGDDLRLEHKSTETCALKDLMKSKYVQSYIGHSFQHAKELLEQGNQVMFVGTPCQIAGLSSYLNKDYDNLLKVDFICHGVPSMDMLKKHLNFIGFADLKSITKIDFRPKITSWVDYLVVEAVNRKYKRKYNFDEYFDFFQKYQNIRRSCMECIYCNGKNKKSDITLADFWGYIKAGVTIPDEADGLSLILANTKKGRCVISELGDDKFNLFPLDIKYAEYVYARKRGKGAGYNKSLRESIVASVYSCGYAKTMKQYSISVPFYKPFLCEIKLYIKKFLGRQ